MAPYQKRAAMGLPDQFIRKPRVALHLSEEGSAMPFSARKPNREAPAWNVPATGGFGGGFETGAAIAFAYMKQRRDAGHRAANRFQLADIVTSLIARDRQTQATGRQAAAAALYGQVRGFIGLLSVALDYHLSCEDVCSDKLDTMPMEDVLASANRGLGLDVKAYEAWLYGTSESEKPAQEIGDASRGGSK